MYFFDRTLSPTECIWKAKRRPGLLRLARVFPGGLDEGEANHLNSLQYYWDLAQQGQRRSDVCM